MSSTEDARAVVGRYLTAWRDGEVATVLDLYHDHLVLVWHGRHDLAGSHRGKDECVDALLRFQARTGRSLHSIDDLVADEDRVDARITERWADESTELLVDRLLLFRVHDSRLVECEILEGDQYAVDEWLASHTD